MSLLKGLTESDDIQQETDTLGGGGPLDSGVYDFTIEMAYVIESKGGATGVVLNFVNSQNQSHRETLYVTSGKEKGQKNFYVTQDGTKRYLPGYTMANDIAMLTTEKKLGELEPETKTIKVYSPEAGKEVPSDEEVLTEMVGQEIKLGLVKQLQDKYQEPETSVERTSIAKVFHAETGMTVVEAKAGMEEGSFINDWAEKNKGKVQDRRKKSKEGGNTQVGASATKRSPLFSKK